MATKIKLNRHITNGAHTFKIISSDVTEGKDTPSGFDYVRFRAICMDKGPDEGFEISFLISLAPQAQFKLVEFLDAVRAPETGEVEPKYFHGKLLKMVVENKMIEGANRVDVTRYLAVDQPSPQQTPIAGLPGDARGSRPAPNLGTPNTDKA